MSNEQRDHNGVPLKWAVPTRSLAQLVEVRKASRHHLAVNYGHRVTEFTCDMCTSAPTCSLAFDGYNTNGDCLLEK